MELAPNEMRRMGLIFMKIDAQQQQDLGMKICDEMFRSLYGCPAEVMSDMWEDLRTTNIANAQLSPKEDSIFGLKMFCMAHYYLWNYPRSSKVLQVQFYPIGEHYTRGKPFWKWVGRIAALLPTKIKWMPELDDPNGEIFIVSVDGVDCRTDERRDHAVFNINNKRCSHKFKHAALRYEVAVAIYDEKIVWVNGPFIAGKTDLQILRAGQKDGSGTLLDRIPAGKMLVADRGYQTSQPTEIGKMAFKRNEDPSNLQKYKGRVMCRQETVNSRIKQYKVLSETFRQCDEVHEICFKAICVIIQYQLDCGAAFLYDV